LADFARILASIDKVMSWKCYDLFLSNSRSLMEQVVEDSELAQALIEFMTGIKSAKWEGTPKELLEHLTAHVPGVLPPKDWPTTPRGLTGQLQVFTEALRANGLTVITGEAAGPRTRKGGRIIIHKSRR
jgi:hypothetical protein